MSQISKTGVARKGPARRVWDIASQWAGSRRSGYLHKNGVMRVRRHMGVLDTTSSGNSPLTSYISRPFRLTQTTRELRLSFPPEDVLPAIVVTVRSSDKGFGHPPFRVT